MDKGLSYDDVLLKPQKSEVTSLSSVDVSVNIAGVELEAPVMSAAMDTVTGEKMSVELAKSGGIGVIHRFLSIEQQAEIVKNVKKEDVVSAAAIGLNDQERMAELVKAGVDMAVIDIAHGHHTKLLEELQNYSDKYSDTVIVAGNVATAEAAKDLENAGADAVKVGIGPGSACTTRKVTGAGVPQFTAVKTCAEAVQVPVIADGGIRKPGDLVKALMAGADAGMIGGMFAGTKEAPGELVEDGSQKYKIYRGMSTEEAAKKRAEREGRELIYSDKVSEGVVSKKEYQGSIEDVLNRLLGGLRSGISYCGADNVADARQNAKFIEISESTQGRNGGHIKSL